MLAMFDQVQNICTYLFQIPYSNGGGQQLPYGTFDECGHDSDAQPTAAHDEDLDELASPLEVLRHHQRRAVSGQPHADTHHRPFEIQCQFITKLKSVSMETSNVLRTMGFSSVSRNLQKLRLDLRSVQRRDKWRSS